MTRRRDYLEEGRRAWADLRSGGLTVQEALERMKELNLGLGVVLQTLCDVESLSTKEAAELFERRGDYEDFKDR